MIENIVDNIVESPKKMSKTIWVSVFVVIVLFGAGSYALSVYGKANKDVVLPGVYVGDIAVGSMTQPMLVKFFQEMNEKLANEGIELTFNINEKKEKVIVYPTVIGNDEYINLVAIDPQKAAEQLIHYKKSPNNFLLGIVAIESWVTKPHVSIHDVIIDQNKFSEVISEKLKPFEKEAKNANINITSIKPFEYTIASSSVGVMFNYISVYDQIINSWSELAVPSLQLMPEVANPNITEDQVVQVAQKAQQIIDAGDIDIQYTDTQTKQNKVWKFSTKDIQSALEVKQIEEKNDTQIVIGLQQKLVQTFIEQKIVSEVEKEAKSAKFSINQDGKVKEFQGSQSGIMVDQDAMYIALDNAVIERTTQEGDYTKSIDLIINQTEPEVKTGEVNDLGINEILGVGYSNFSGSPSNRVKNIRLAVQQKLNGLLLKPGEEFSMLDALGPFTIEGGYLPELVIKGDEIKPEVAGGLCQVGTTMFRAAMVAGLDITQRRNHSLVVSYYNDPRNGLPGTDATIYDPAPDFRFKNDTKNHVLITTEMNTKTGDLFFTIWGTNDGRTAYYTEPVVKKWINAGETKEIQTTALAPGERKCQEKHNGAETSFTYVKKLKNGEKIERVFESYYRPLPQICLVGVAQLSPPVGDATDVASPEESSIIFADDFSVPTGQ